MSIFDGLTPKDQRPRRNIGLECPFSKRQTTAISVVVLDALFTFAVVIPLLTSPARWIFLGLFLPAFLCTAAVAVITMCIDPVDPSAQSEGDPTVKPAEKLWCQSCHAWVRLDSKHCWMCNKCVSNFDHHCPWLNTCVGTKNYAFFFVSVVVTMVMISLMMAAMITLLVQHASADSDGILSTWDFIAEEVLIFFISVFMTVNGILLCLDIFLLAFHIFLFYKGLTTYDYLTGKQSDRSAQYYSQASQDETPSYVAPEVAQDDQDDSYRDSAQTGSVLEDGFYSFKAKEDDDGVIKSVVSGFIFGSEVQAEQPEDSSQAEQQVRTIPSMSSLPTSTLVQWQVPPVGSATTALRSGPLLAAAPFHVARTVST